MYPIICIRCGKLLCEADGLTVHVKRGYVSQEITVSGKTSTCYNIIRDKIPDTVDNGSPCGGGKVS